MSAAPGGGLACVVNLSEGRRAALVERLASSAGACLLDVHADSWHHRAVLSLGGPGLEEAVREVARLAVAELDLSAHTGVHPRLGVVDVVPFVPLAGATMAEAIRARDAFAAWAGSTLGLPCFLYGPERSLPDIRRLAVRGLAPDTGPAQPHPRAGAACVGARRPLIAYNLWLSRASISQARSIARDLRSPSVRALGLLVGDRAQVSCNLVDPLVVGPAEIYDAVARRVAVERAELVGLVPAAVLGAVPRARWAQLDLAADRSIESRLAAAAPGRGGLTPISGS